MIDDYRILVAVDLKTGTEHLLAEAQRYAKALNAIVDIVHVGAPDPEFVPYIKGTTQGGRPVDIERQDKAEELRTEHQQTQALAARLRAAGVRIDRVLMVQGPISETILAEVRKLGADLLILGSHHHNAIYRIWYGNTAIDIIKQAPCALLVVPTE
jgi:nucleotide-binding universal stress UspA family protein